MTTAFVFTPLQGNHQSAIYDSQNLYTTALDM